VEVLKTVKCFVAIFVVHRILSRL